MKCYNGYGSFASTRLPFFGGSWVGDYISSSFVLAVSQTNARYTDNAGCRLMFL